jgi:hypothetical protein
MLRAAGISPADGQALVDELDDAAGAYLGRGEKELEAKAAAESEAAKAATAAVAEWNVKKEEIEREGEAVTAADRQAYESWRRTEERLERLRESNKRTRERLTVGPVDPANPLRSYRWPAMFKE